MAHSKTQNRRVAVENNKRRVERRVKNQEAFLADYALRRLISQHNREGGDL